jgi:hypothetical protein
MLQREAFYINYESISANFHDAKTSSVQSTKRASEKKRRKVASDKTRQATISESDKLRHEISPAGK